MTHGELGAGRGVGAAGWEPQDVAQSTSRDSGSCSFLLFFQGEGRVVAVPVPGALWGGLEDALCPPMAPI